MVISVVGRAIDARGGAPPEKLRLAVKTSVSSSISSSIMGTLKENCLAVELKASVKGPTAE